MRHGAAWGWRWRAAASLLGFGVLLTAGPARGAPRCVIPTDLTQLEFPLGRTAHLLAARAPIRIVALGSSSTAGAGASSTATTYPSRLTAELSQLFPSQPIAVFNRGVNGEQVVDMLARFEASVVAEHPTLVLWQLGTNAVLHDQGSLSNALIHEGTTRLKSCLLYTSPSPRD